jgi:hypothetical protein
MPTVIDSLVVELGLDASKFTLQQREALETAKRLEEQQVKAAKNIEYGAGRASSAIGGIKTQALEMLAVLTGGAGVVTFATQLTHANASLGRLERNLGQSAATISKWQGVARIFGGDAEQMAQSFTSISDAFAGWKIGMVSPLIADLRAISTAGGKVIDINKGVEQSYLDLAENLRNINSRDPAQAGLLGRKIGLDPALYDAMITGNLQKVLDLVAKIGVATTADTDAFGELEKRMGMMGLKAESLGRKVLGGEGGVASGIMELADILNMTPGDAWAYLNNPNRKALGQNRGNGSGTGPGSNILGANTNNPVTSGAFVSQAEKEQFIRSEAARLNINPNVAMQVAKSEGFTQFSGDNETSFGAFQLHVTPGGRGRAVGDQFRAATGLDPSNPANERAGISFALNEAKKHGWSAYHGAARVGVGEWEGIERGGGATSSTSTTEVNINGPINVTPPAGPSPDAWASSFAAAVKKQSFTAQANSGQQ